MGGYDVGIIGAGVHGAAAAFHLANRGIKAVVFERRAPAGGPTGRSSAICRAYYTNVFLARVARESIEMLADFATVTHGRHSGFHRTGFLFLHPPEDVAALEEAAARLAEAGVTVKLLDRTELMERFPEVALDGIEAGVWEPDAGYADPAGTTLGLLERAIELGAEPRMAGAVTSIELADGGGANVRAADGAEVHCRRLLIAAGPWTGRLASLVDVHLPLTVERHVVATGGWGSAPPMSYGHADLVAGYYCRPEGHNLFLLGWLHSAATADPDRFKEQIADEEAAALFEAAMARVPALGGAEGRGGWASLYDVSPDWQPVIGEIAPDVFVDAGTSGHGFKLAPALGRYVADLVMGEGDPELEQFHPRRFTEGHLLGAGYRSVRILG